MTTQVFKCRYCEKEFRREKSLEVHLCEQKRRALQENEMHVRLGLQAYLRFYEMTQGSAKFKTYEHFSKSPYYNAFVNFGKYCQDVRCVNFSFYLDWLLKNSKKIDRWCSDKLYEEWLPTYLNKEDSKDALIRGLKEMELYAESHPELKNGFVDYFRYGNANRICYHITTGRISPWIIYNCTSGIEFIENLGEEQISIIMPWINPEYWQVRLRDYMADAEWAKGILKTAGL
jgi:hypothetical protein